MACFALNDKETCRKYFMEALDIYPNTKEIITQVFPNIHKWFEEWGV
jgi:hypothetical protein